MHPSFEQRLYYILSEDESADSDWESAVAIVQNRNRWLLGLARNTNDSRTGKWCHPGGHIKSGETPERAAERECWEETGIKVHAVGEPFSFHRDGVAFVHCRTNLTSPKWQPNHEFAALGFFTVPEMRSFRIRLFDNVLDLIRRVQ